MFASSSAAASRPFCQVLQRIGEAVNVEPGAQRHRPFGQYSDPLGEFPSNWHLSLARAEAVKQILAQKVKDPTRLTAEGKA